MPSYKKFTKNFLSKERTFTKKECNYFICSCRFQDMIHGRNLFKGIATIIIEMKIEERYQKPIEEFVRRALERYRDEIESIILFGSVARGEGKEDPTVKNVMKEGIKIT